MASYENDHCWIIEAGWAYRANERGWIIYRDPVTGLWHTGAEAAAIIASRTQPVAA